MSARNFKYQCNAILYPSPNISLQNEPPTAGNFLDKATCQLADDLKVRLFADRSSSSTDITVGLKLKLPDASSETRASQFMEVVLTPNNLRYGYNNKDGVQDELRPYRDNNKDKPRPVLNYYNDSKNIDHFQGRGRIGQLTLELDRSFGPPKVLLPSKICYTNKATLNTIARVQAMFIKETRFSIFFDITGLSTSFKNYVGFMKQQLPFYRQATLNKEHGLFFQNGKNVKVLDISDLDLSLFRVSADLSRAPTDRIKEEDGKNTIAAATLNEEAPQVTSSRKRQLTPSLRSPRKRARASTSNESPNAQEIHTQNDSAPNALDSTRQSKTPQSRQNTNEHNSTTEKDAEMSENRSELEEENQGPQTAKDWLRVQNDWKEYHQLVHSEYPLAIGDPKLRDLFRESLRCVVREDEGGMAKQNMKIDKMVWADDSMSVDDKSLEELFDSYTEYVYGRYSAPRSKKEYRDISRTMYKAAIRNDRAEFYKELAEADFYLYSVEVNLADH